MEPTVDDDELTRVEQSSLPLNERLVKYSVPAILTAAVLALFVLGIEVVRDNRVANSQNAAPFYTDQIAGNGVAVLSLVVSAALVLLTYSLFRKTNEALSIAREQNRQTAAAVSETKRQTDNATQANRQSARFHRAGLLPVLVADAVSDNLANLRGGLATIDFEVSNAGAGAAFAVAVSLKAAWAEETDDIGDDGPRILSSEGGLYTSKYFAAIAPGQQRRATLQCVVQGESYAMLTIEYKDLYGAVGNTVLVWPLREALQEIKYGADGEPEEMLFSGYERGEPDIIKLRPPAFGDEEGDLSAPLVIDVPNGWYHEEWRKRARKYFDRVGSGPTGENAGSDR